MLNPVPHSAYPGLEPDNNALWKTLLQQVFEPLEITATDDATSALPWVDQQGSGLHVPATQNTGALILRGAEYGRRLFNAGDIRTVTALRPLIAWAHARQDACANAVWAERSRIKQDLQDDLAPRLYAQILRAPDLREAASSRSALAEVRLLVDQLETPSTGLKEALQQWREQIDDLCDLASLALHWQQPEHLPDLLLGVQAQANPLRILREAVSNATIHARPTYIEVAIRLELPEITLTLQHDGVGAAPQSWQPGRGLLNMQARARQLSGEIRWSQPQPLMAKMQARLRLEGTQ